MRGENWGCLRPKIWSIGTSPRARGKRRIAVSPRCHVGNIPACAGKTKPRSGNHCGQAEHPRVRGENAGHLRSCFWPVGTSPRARGKLRALTHSYHLIGNIPACAGKTTVRHDVYPSETEHPRVRGENRRHSESHPGSSGTSPRARGKLQSA